MKSYIKHDPWKIIEEELIDKYQKISESLCSLGNGRIGQRANFEEDYSGPSLQGSYIAGIYYPDKTRVGWWKNGYPEYFAKVLNAPSWIRLRIRLNGQLLDLHTCQVMAFRRVLDMQQGLLQRSAQVEMPDGSRWEIHAQRLCHYQHRDLGLLRYEITLLEGPGQVDLHSLLDGDICNEDANYDEQFWHQYLTQEKPRVQQLRSVTKKTAFEVVCSQHNKLFISDKEQPTGTKALGQKAVAECWEVEMNPGDVLRLDKYVTIHSSFYHPPEQLWELGETAVAAFADMGFDQLLSQHQKAWQDKWAESDIVIEGDLAAQQGIRFNIFQLNQTYTGDDPRLNIGPKGFTGEKYGGSTYWDTEAYCLPFYLSTAPLEVARNLVLYRYKHLPKAIENAQLLGFGDGAALYPMVTMTGEECHNEWEITFEEIHRNGAIAYAIYDYVQHSGDHDYLGEYGVEVLIGIARFWAQRVHWSRPKGQYVMHGVTGPNEYENNINNNWYTNYIARWCLQFAYEQMGVLKATKPDRHNKVVSATQLSDGELDNWWQIADQLYLPADPERGIFLQQEGFLEKEIKPADSLPVAVRPLNQHWSWDRILRSCYIKQADVLQGIYLFEEDFDIETIRRNFSFYEPLTVHESSLSPCVHAILATVIGDHEKAYEMYLRTARLDLDDYNNDTEDGCHITSMAGTWMAVVKGFAGLRVRDGVLSLRPHCPEQWDAYRFRIKYRGRDLEIDVQRDKLTIRISGEPMSCLLYDEPHPLRSGEPLTLPIVR